MDDDAGRLVDHEQVLVLVRDAKRHLLAFQLPRCRLRYVHLHVLAAF
jgi:hypothetical protein